VSPALSCLCLAGPTAAGKTAAALAIARALPVEIVSVDTALVYRGMDIGTAKPSAAERETVPHHLIDILDPAQAYSAARFVGDARSLIDAIRARGRLPLLVGGTMLYFRALFQGLHEMPPADAAVRAALDDEAFRRGGSAMHAELARVDPVTAARLPAGDTQRIQRALEVFRLSGRPMSSFHREPLPASAAPPLLSLEPASRAWLHERIALRFTQMLDAGLVDEVRALRARGDLNAGMPSMRCVGYRQTWEALDHDELDELPERGIAATRQLAKRQITWLRGMAQREVLACDAPGVLAQVVERARHHAQRLMER
jgi:tRNA dimethylallyltransferase